MKAPISNQLFDALPPFEVERMLAATESIVLPVRANLYEPGVRPKYAYFLTNGIASVVVTASSGQIAEVGIIGREGLSCAVHLLGRLAVPNECFMQVAGSGRRLLYTDLEALFEESQPLRTLVLAFVQMLAINAQQLAACNAIHTVDQRLARWLLIVHDRMHTSGYSLTHEFLAEMLAVQRPTLSIAAAALQREGVIHYRHGHLTILKRAILESSACECYGISRNLLQHLYKIDTKNPDPIPKSDETLLLDC